MQNAPLHVRKVIILFCILFFSVILDLNAQTADFDVSQRFGCAGFSVQFTDISTSPGDPIVSWEWDLGGVISILRNPGRIFTRPGFYDICLKITTASGQINNLCEESYIEVFELPTIDFIGDNLSGCPPLLVNFQDNSFSPNGDIIEWSWDLGGSSNVIVSQDPEELIWSQYSTSDNFTISLTVADEKGCRKTLSKDEYIQTSSRPEINITADQNTTCNSTLTVNFSNLSDTSNIIFNWDFGNGITHTGPFPEPILFSQTGSYTTQVIAKDVISNCSDTLLLPNFIQVGGQPLVITSDNTGGCAPLSSSFNIIAQSTDSIVWDFGDGVTESGAEVTHIFDIPGCYEVSVIKYSSDCTFEGSLDTCIEVFPNLDYEINYTPPSACSVPHLLDLNIESNQEIIADWYLNDSLIITGPNPTIPILDFGTYAFRVELSNEYGCSTSQIFDSISIQPFQINLNYPQSGCTPLSGTLNYSSQSNSEVTDWHWSIYENNSLLFSSEEEFPPFNIADTGRYHVELIASNATGCQDTAFSRSYIAVGNEPNVQFSAEPLVICLEDQITFNNNSNPSNSWLWEFGDGNTSVEENPIINYLTPGIFTVTLTAWHNGCMATDSISDYVEVLLPKAVATPVYNCDNPYEVYFENTSLGADSTHWNFGTSLDYDHSLDTTYSPTFNFMERGIYTVNLTVYNFTTNCEHSVDLEIIITDPIANFVVDTTRGCAALPIQVTDFSTDAVGWSYYINNELIFSDSLNSNPLIIIEEEGQYDDLHLVVTDIHQCLDTFNLDAPIFVSDITPGFLPTPNPVCLGDPMILSDTSISLFAPIAGRQWVIEEFQDTFHRDQINITLHRRGLHNVNLIVNNEWGCVQEINLPIEASKPLLDFSYDTLGCTFADIKFNNFSQGSSLEFIWDFGDGNTSDQAEPEYRFENDGIYNLCLTAEDKWGCKTDTCSQLITIQDPIANFTGDPTVGDCPPLIVNFENLSNNNLFNRWDFGDGTGISDQISPRHIYNNPGNYDVQLVAGLTNVCTDTLLLENFIQITGPTGQFSYTADTSCVPLEIQFTASSEIPYFYTWDFGDGNLEIRTDLKSNDTINYTYPRAGNFIPLLIIKDEFGCEIFLEGNDPIITHDLSLDYFIEVDDPCTFPTQADLFNFSQSTTEYISFTWIVNGPTTDTLYGVQPDLIFTSPGSYQITLEAENEYCQQTLSYPNPIIIGTPPVALFEQDGSIFCLEDNISFRDISTIESGNITSRIWRLDGVEIGQDSILIINTESPGIYQISLQIFTDAGCNSTFQQSITVLPEVNFEIPDNLTVCLGESIFLQTELDDLSNFEFYGWIQGLDTLCHNCTSLEITPQENNSIIFSTTTINGCQKEDTTEIQVFDNPDFGLDTLLTICKYSTVQIVISDLQPSDKINWDLNTPGLDCYNCPNPIANPLLSTQYDVTVTNLNGCTTTKSIFVEVIQDFADLSIDDHVICSGSSIRLESPNSLKYNWTTETESCNSCSVFEFTPVNSTQINIEYFTELGCSVQDTAFVKVKDINAIFAGDDLQICVGESVTLRAEGEGNIKWSCDNFISTPNSQEILVKPSISTTYHLTLTEDQCVLNDTVNVIVENQSYITLSTDTICPGDTAWIYYSGLYDQITWSPEPNVVLDSSAAFIFTETTDIEVESFFRSCATDFHIPTIEVSPEVKIDVPGSILYYPDEKVNISISLNYDGNFDIHWTPEDETPCIDCLDFTWKPEGTFVLNVDATDLNTGCKASEKIRVQERITCPDNYVYVPNAFTPNLDGENDIFKIQSEFAQEINQFQIYDRWGELMFQTDNISEGWDGKYRGLQAPQGVYVYTISLPCLINGRNVKISGDLTLLR